MILSAAIISRDGTIHVGKHYCEWSKSTIEGLYTAFSRQITKGKQHTVINAKTVRYLYQAINDFYCVIITDTNSNILEDIKTLRLFAGAVNEYASAIGKGLINEESISQSRYDVSLAFDEIAAHEDRQLDNFSQLRLYMEMKSEEEKVALESVKKKESLAKAKMAEKAKELDQQRRNEMLSRAEAGHEFSNRSAPSAMSSESKITDPTVEEDILPSKPSRVMSKGRAMKLRVRK